MDADKRRSDFIPDRAMASQVSELMLDFTARLNESLRLVQQRQGREASSDYRHAVGKVMGEILLEVLNPLYREHPELKPEGFE